MLMSMCWYHFFLITTFFTTTRAAARDGPRAHALPPPLPRMLSTGNGSSLPWTPYSLVNSSICSKDNYGRIYLTTDTECKEAAAQLMRDVHNITVDPGISLRYDKTQPMGCYVVDQKTVVRNLDESDFAERSLCLPNMLCVCKTCAPGEYRDQTTDEKSTCSACPAGYKSPDPNSIVCDECSDPSDGSPKLYSIASAASCAFTSCPVGTEVNPSRDSSLACYSCPTGKYNVLNPDTGLTYSRCKFCKKGLRFVNAHSQCEGCIAGMYQAQNVANNNEEQKCKLCMGGLSSVKSAALCDYTPDTCPEGTKKSGFACLECLNGKFTSVPGSANCNYCGLGKAFTNSNTACTYCPSGTYQTDSDVPSVTCKSCPNGTASILNTDLDYTCQYTASTCPAGTYHNGATECIACEVGKVRTAIGATSPTECLFCPMGYQYVDTMQPCTACPGGQYQQHGAIYSPVCKTCEKGQAAVDAQTSCTECSIGQYQDGIHSLTNWGCRSCKYGHGYVATNVTCLACQKGQIQPSNNTPSAICTDCPLGKYVVQSKSTQCLYCPPGSEFVAIDTACRNCLNETVQDSSTTIDAKCHVCPSGYTFVQHNEVCATCPTGRYDVAGNIKLANQEACATCDVGQSSAHWRSPCTHCSVGLHQESNVSKVWGCKHCATGRQYVDVNSSCTNCVAGQYQSETKRLGHSGIQTCKRCQAGKEFTTTKKDCEVCKIGKYQSENNADGVSCLTCGKGKDAPSKKLPCEGCPSGKYQPFDVSITYTCTFCTGFETAIVPFTNQGVTEWPPIMNDQGITEGVTVTDYKFEGNFSAANASYCPYFTLQSGRCDDHKGGVYILNQNDCVKGATTIGWKKDLYTKNGYNGQPNLNNYTQVGEIIFPESNSYYTYPWPLGCFDRDQKSFNSWLYLNNDIAGNNANIHKNDLTWEMENIDDCNTKFHDKGRGRCICETCAPGTYKAAMICNDDKECVLEKDKTKKYYTKLYQCRRCEVGRYQNEIGMNDCKTCDVGQYQEIKHTDTLTAPTLSCKECPSGYLPKEPISSTCVSCTMGKEFVAIDQPCTDCVSGKYQDINATSFEASEQCCVEFDNQIETGQFYNPLKINPDSIFRIKRSRFEYYSTVGILDKYLGEYVRTPSDSFASCDWTPACKITINKYQNVQCKRCQAGRAPPDDKNKCSKCAIGRYQELKSSQVWGCKTCPAGYEHVSEKSVCRMCEHGQYQSNNDQAGETCKGCSEGRDAPNKESECQNCVAGQYQNLPTSITYGCSEIQNGACKDAKAGQSVVDGTDVEPGRLTVRMFHGPCCTGAIISMDVIYLNECVLDHKGSVMHACSGTSHTVKAWTNNMCDADFKPYYDNAQKSNTCINTRDGNSIYYDCSKASMDAYVLSSSNKKGMSLCTMVVTLVVLWCHFTFF